MVERSPQYKPDKKKTDAEIRKTISDCESVHRVMTGGRKVPFYWKYGEGWFFTFTGNGEVTGDLKDVYEKPAEYSQAVTLHEGIHSKISQVIHFDLADWNQLGFAIGFNWVEDCRIENDADSFYNKGKELIKTHLEIDVLPGGGLDYRRTAQEGLNKDIVDAIGYIPKHMALGAALRQFFYYKEFVGAYQTPEEKQAFVDDLKDWNPEIGAAFEAILPDFEEFYQKITNQAYAPQELIDELAKESTAIYRDKIWPKYKELVDTSREEQALKDFIEQLIDGASFEVMPAGGGQGFGIMIDINSLPPEVQQEIRDKIQEQKEQQKASQNQPSTEAGDQQAESSPSQQQGSQGQASGGQGQQPGENQGGQSSESQPGQGQGSGENSEQGDNGEKTQVPWSELSQEAKEAIKDTFQKLSPEDQEHIQQQADHELGEVEDKANQTLQGHNDNKESNQPTQLAEKNPKPPGKPPGQSSGGQSQDAESGEMEPEPENEQSDQSEVTKPAPSEMQMPEVPQFELPPVSQEDVDALVEQALKNTNENTEGKFPGNIKAYFDVLRRKRVSNAVTILTEKFGPLFRPNMRSQKRYSDEGDVFDFERWLEDKLDKVDPRAFVTEGQPLGRLYRFTLVVDMSSSMVPDKDFDPNAEDKFSKVMEMIVILSELLAKLGMEFAVVGYPAGHRGGNRYSRVYKSYTDTTPDDEELPDEVRAKIGKMFDDVGGNTPTSDALSETLSYLYDHEVVKSGPKAAFNFVLLFTDGQPNEGQAKAAEHIRAWETWGSEAVNLIMSGFGIGAGTEFVNQLFKTFPLGLREKMAQKLNGLAKRSAITSGTSLSKIYSPDSLDKAFSNTDELVEVLPDIIEWMLEHPEEFR